MLLTKNLMMIETISFNLNGNILKCEDEVKHFRVTFDVMLNFNSHVSNIFKMASTLN